MQFGVIANLKRPGAGDVISRLLRWIEKSEVFCYFCEELRDAASGNIEIIQRELIPEKSDIILSMGGDGTLLSTARLVGSRGIPILGINIGSLGFLTEQTPESLERNLDRVVAGDYAIQERMVLATTVLNEVNSETLYALNDVVVGRKDIRMVHLALYSNGDYICSYAADGLIISTPTGSTAYSLAVGGPILNPEMDALIASPIAPHTLTSRPLVFSADEELTLEVESKTDEAHLTLDGQSSISLKNSDKVSIRKGGYYVRLVRFKENSFYKVLRSKLQWGVLPIQSRNRGGN